MLIRSIVAIVAIVLFIPIAVFLRSANAAPLPEKPPQVIVVTHCGKDVLLIGYKNNRTRVNTLDSLAHDDAAAGFFLEILKTGNILVFRVEEFSGIKCPVIM